MQAVMLKKGKLITTPPHAPKKKKKRKNSTFTLNKAAIIQYFLCDSSLSSSPAMLIKKKSEFLTFETTIKQSLLVLWHREVIVSLENNTSQTATDHNVTSQLQLQLNSALSKAKFSEKHSPSHTINKYTADLQM